MTQVGAEEAWASGLSAGAREPLTPVTVLMRPRHCPRDPHRLKPPLPARSWHGGALVPGGGAMQTLAGLTAPGDRLPGSWRP